MCYIVEADDYLVYMLIRSNKALSLDELLESKDSIETKSRTVIDFTENGLECALERYHWLIQKNPDTNLFSLNNNPESKRYINNVKSGKTTILPIALDNKISGILNFSY